MIRPRRDDNTPKQSMFGKFARIFGIIMTLLYVAMGIFIMFAGDSLNLDIPDSMKYALGGILILYGIVRFVRVYNSTRSNKNRYED
ncbi:hypothetical protein [Pontibacter flavimaris]|uniref:Uncharacterized protein n=1 Tax=Pontibacter flavimaris TaxID=1797110 RepID=A0A1Q5PFY5_9BACT|nr:hypothetical protein [Pontibacter flavimaris]OKL41156.1 hypothetical protein A3841_15150 [Pontibacter flavimaris]